MITFTDELHNKLVDMFEARAKNFGLKGKKKIAMQAEFFVGAIAVIDVLNVKNGGTDSCVTPRVYFSIMNGEELRKID